MEHLKKMFSQCLEDIKLNGLAHDSIVILGAGACNDIPLSLVRECFKSIVLVDINHFPEKSGCQRIVCDITGLNNSFPQADSSERFFEQLSNAVDVCFVPQELKTNSPYSLVVSDLIFTQFYPKYVTYSEKHFGEVHYQNFSLFLGKLLTQHRLQTYSLCVNDGSILHIILKSRKIVTRFLKSLVKYRVAG
ncbi:hypothetical protein AGMMS49975_14270 [Clostridia bacterium]|nr:hypothetical protein AGMMS49975_14270 [Clostridia bacterium]